MSNFIKYFDMGLYEGKELDMFLALQEECEIYGFEAHPDYAAKLQEKYKDVSNVHIMNLAITDGNKIKRLYLSGGQGDSIFPTKNNVSSDYMAVTGVLFSDWVKGIDLEDSFNIVRFNIEGAELHLMRDLINTGLYKEFDLFLGAEPGADIKKCSEIADQHDDYIDLLTQHGIEILPYCYNLDCVDLKGIIQKAFDKSE